VLSFMPMAALAYLFKALGRGRRKRGAREENPALGRVRLCAAYPVVRVTHWSNRGPIPKAKGPHGPVCDCTEAPQRRSERVHRLMIHYVSVGSNDIKRARSFYDPLMSLIGFRVLKSSAASVHYGASDIVFSLETPENGRPATRATASMWLFKLQTGRQSGDFTRPQSKTAAPTKGLQVSETNTTRTIRRFCAGPERQKNRGSHIYRARKLLVDARRPVGWMSSG